MINKYKSKDVIKRISSLANSSEGVIASKVFMNMFTELSLIDQSIISKVFSNKFFFSDKYSDHFDLHKVNIFFMLYGSGPDSEKSKIYEDLASDENGIKRDSKLMNRTLEYSIYIVC